MANRNVVCSRELQAEESVDEEADEQQKLVREPVTSSWNCSPASASLNARYWVVLTAATAVVVLGVVFAGVCMVHRRGVIEATSAAYYDFQRKDRVEDRIAELQQIQEKVGKELKALRAVKDAEVGEALRANASWAGAGRCGVATNMLDHNEPGMDSFCSMGLDFWWNWAPSLRAEYQAPCARGSFVPMIWGSGKDNAHIAGAAGETFSFLMGYNEPDLYGPPPYPGANYLSSGSFAPTFHCGSAELAAEWQSIVKSFRKSSPSGIVVSPAMADPSGFASAGPDAEECNSAPQTPHHHLRFCTSWLRCFKESVIKVDCSLTEDEQLNCWDAISVLQLHTYEYEADRLIEKVEKWTKVWAEDVNGYGDRTKKTLWLTEFAHAGTTENTDPDGSGRAFMRKSVQYLKDSPYVSGWSWFSSNNKQFASFTINGVEPKSDFWASDLITSDGEKTVLGEEYEAICRDIPPTPAQM